MQRSDSDRAYAFFVIMLVASAAICYVLDSGLIDKVISILR